MSTVELLKELSKNLSSSRINPTVIFNEGWMTRILVEISIKEHLIVGNIDFSKFQNWSSEALIDSPFVKANEKREGYTHADVILGDFTINYSQQGNVIIKDDAKILGIIEAKMGSNLSQKTTNADEYNQASRNICCLAYNTLQTNGNCEFFFIVVAPRIKIRDNDIESQINYSTLYNQILKRFKVSNKPINSDLLRKIEDNKNNIFSISYEEWISKIKNQSDKKLLEDFYYDCLIHNKIQNDIL